MSGSVFPAPTTAIADQRGQLTPAWRRFFQQLFERTGGTAVASNAALNGNSNQQFAVQTASSQTSAVPLAQYRSQPGQAPFAVNVGASPWTFSAPSNGFIVLDGGTVSNVEFQRGGVQATLGNPPEMITMRQADQVIITFTTAPEATWFPN